MARRDYTPSLPHGLPNPHAGDRPDEGDGGIAWTPAPTTSHIAMFRFYDARLHKFLTKFPGAIGRGRSELHVRFRGKNGQGVVAYYAYFFDSPEAGQVIYDKLAGSGHPYGEVLHPLVIRAGVPYTRIG